MAEEIRDGRLERVMPGWDMPGLDVHAVMPARRYVPAKVRAFTDFLAGRWRKAPELRAPPSPRRRSR